MYLTPSGGKYWRYKYRHEGKEKTLSLGAYPDVPPECAKSKTPLGAATARSRCRSGCAKRAGARLSDHEHDHSPSLDGLKPTRYLGSIKGAPLDVVVRPFEFLRVSKGRVCAVRLTAARARQSFRFPVEFRRTGVYDALCPPTR